MKILFIIFGIISFILGAIGVVLPILPTTPFLLLSAFLFSKSSDRFHEYLIQTKLYQKYINEMVIERKTTRKEKESVIIYSNTYFFDCCNDYTCMDWKDMFTDGNEYSSFYYVKESRDY